MRYPITDGGSYKANCSKSLETYSLPLCRQLSGVFLSFLLLIYTFSPLLIFANPQGGIVRQGQANLSYEGNSLLINQGTDRAIIDWNRFSIAAGETTRFIQPSSRSAALNRVTSGNISSIYGNLEANGQVMLVNPNGILIGESGKINVNSFIGSTLNIPNSDFMDGGDYHFKKGDVSGNIKNLGSISATGGDVFLIAHSVANHGYIGAHNGTIGIATGSDEVLIKESGEQRIFIKIKKKKKVKSESSPEKEKKSDSDKKVEESEQLDEGLSDPLDPKNELVAEEAVAEEALDEDLSEESEFVKNSDLIDNLIGETDANQKDNENNNTVQKDFSKSSGLKNEKTEEDSFEDNSFISKDFENQPVEEVKADTNLDSKKSLILNSEAQEPEFEWIAAKHYKGSLGSSISLAEPLKKVIDSTNEESSSDSVEDLSIEEKAKQILDEMESAEFVNMGNIEAAISTEIQAVGGNSYALAINNTGIIRAKGVQFDETTGRISLIANKGIVSVAGTLDASSTSPNENYSNLGGEIQVLGQEVELTETAFINVSGNSGGGEILIGGDFQGKNEAVMNAENTKVLSGAVIQANAVNVGDGGRVIVWSDGTTDFEGHINATAGVQNGNGGFAEVSGKQYLDIMGASVDLTSKNGKKGTLLLDPDAIVIQSASPDIKGDSTSVDIVAITDLNNVANYGSVTSVITSGSVNTLLAGADLSLLANNTITLNDSLSWGSGQALTLQTSTSDIAINASISAGSGNLNFSAGGSITQNSAITSSGTTTISAGSNITLTNASNNFGTVNVTGSTVQITDTNAIELGASTITSAFTVNAGGAITDSGTINANGITTTLNAGANAITLNSSGSDYGTLDVNGSVTNLAVTDTDDIIIAAVTTSGTLDITAGGAITQSGIIEAGSATTISNAGNTVTLTNASNNFGTVNVTGSTVQITDTNAIELGASTITSAFTVNAGGAITDSGTINANGITTTLNAGANAITLNSSGSDYGTLDVNGSVTNLAVTDTDDIIIAAVTTSGTLDITAGGAITQSGIIEAGSATTISNAGNTVTLTNASNNFGTVNVTGSTVQITDTNAIELGASTITSAFTVNAGGAITDSGTINANGITTTLNAGANAITLNSSGSDYGTLDVNGSVTNLAVTDTDDIIIAAVTTSGTLDITAGGAITQSGIIEAGSATTISNAGNTVTLTNASNNFGTVNVTGSTVQITDTNAIELGASTITSAFTVNAGGAITDSGTINANGITTTLNAGANAITLNSSDSDFGTVKLTGSTVQITDTNAIELGASTITSAFTVNAGGAITDSGTINANGITTTLNAGANAITLNSSGSDYGTLDVNGSVTNLAVTDTDDIIIAAVTTSGTLDITAGGAITQSGIIEAGSATTISNAGNTVTLTNASNNFGTVNVTGSTVQITDTNAIELGASTITSAFTVNAGGAITDSGTINANGITTTLNAGANAITLNSSGSDYGTLDVNGSVTNLAVTDTDDIIIAAVTTSGTLDITAGGAITQSGIIEAGSATTISNAGNTVTLTNASNNFGTVNVTGSTVQITDTNAIELGASTITSAFTVNAGGAITDSGTINANGITTTLNAGANAITLNSSGSDYGTLDVNGSVTNLAVTDTDDIIIAAVTTSGTLDITAGGAITQSGIIEAGSATTISNAGNTVTLTNASNNFGTVNVTGSTVQITDTNAIELGASTITSAFTVNAGGAITDSGTINANGITTTLNAGANAITLNSSGSDYGTLDVNGSVTNLAVTDTDDIIIAAVTTSGTLDITAGGAITQSGIIEAGSATTISNAGNTVTLTNASNNFGTVNVTGSTVQITDTNAIELGASTITSAFTVNAGGAITDSGTINANGITTTLNAGANAITLNSSDSDFGTVKLTGSTVQITDTNAIELGASTITSAFTVNAGGAITDSGTINANGITTTLNAGANAITLNSSGSDYGTLDVNGSVTNLAVTDTDDIIIAAVSTSGTLDITAGGAITQSGIIEAGSATTISNAGNTVTLTNASNNFGTVNVTGSTVQITDTNAIDLGASTITSAFTVNAGGAITDSGTINANGITTTLNAGANAITLNTTDSDYGTLDVNGSVTNLAVTDTDDIIIAAVTTSGTLDITAGGAITQSGIIEAGSATTISNAGNTVTLTNASNNFGTVNVTGSTVQITDTNAIDLGASTITSAFTVNAGGAITDSGTINANGITTTLDAGANAITLNSSDSDYGTVKLTGSTVQITDTNAIDLGASTITSAFTVNAGGAITDSGTINANGITTTLNAGANAITLNTTDSDYGTLDVNGSVTNLAVTDTDDIIIAAVTTSGTLDITAGGAITQSGIIEAGSATTISNAGNIVTLTNASNNFGTVNVTGSTVQITDTNAIDLGASTITSAFTVNAGGAITDSGTINANGITTTLDAGANAITLNTTDSDYGTLDVNGSVTNLAVTDTDDIIIAAVTTSGTLDITAGGAITQSGIIEAGGNTNVYSTGNITLDNSSNDFQGENRIRTSGSANATYVDENSFVIGNGSASSVGGSFSLTTGPTAGTPVTQTQGITVNQTTTINTAGSTGKGNVVLVDSTDTYLDTSTIGGDFSVTTTGDYASVSGATILVHGDTSLVATGDVYEQADTTLYQGGYSASSAGSSNIIIRKSDGTDINLTDELNNLIASSDITVDGSGNHTVTADLVVVSVSSASSFANSKLSGDAIVLSHADNDFDGNISITTDTADSLPLTGPAINPGNIIQTSGLIANGVTSFRTQNTSKDITLKNSANRFEQNISFVGRNVDVYDGSKSLLKHVDAGGNFNFENASGGISDNTLNSESTFINVVSDATFSSTETGEIVLGSSQYGNVQQNNNKTTNFGTLGVTAASNRVSIIEDSDMNLNQISNTGEIYLNINGALIDNNSTTINVSDGSGGNAGKLIVKALDGIGSGNAIETQITELDAINFTSNHIAIDEVDALSVFQINNQNSSGEIAIQTNQGSSLSDASISLIQGLQEDSITISNGTLTDGDTFAVEINGFTISSGSLSASDANWQIADALETNINADSNVRDAVTAINYGQFLYIKSDSPGTPYTLANLVVTSSGGGTMTSSIQFREGATGTGGNIILDANGINSDIDVGVQASNASSGNITLNADDSIQLSTAASDITTVTGDISFTANVNSASGDSSNVISMTDGSLIDAGSGTIDLLSTGTHGGNITLGGLTTTDSSTSSIELSTGAAVLDGGDTHVDVVSPGRLVVNSTTGFGVSDAIETTLPSIDLTNTSLGAIQMVETDGLDVVKVSQAGDGNVSITSNGVTTVLSSASGGSGIITSGTGAVTIDNGSLLANTLALNNVVTTKGGDVNLNSGGNFSSSAAGDLLTTANSDTGTASGNVSILARNTGSITLLGDITTDGAGNNSGNGSNAGSITVNTSDNSLIIGVPFSANGGNSTGGNGNGGHSGNISITTGDTGSDDTHAMTVNAALSSVVGTGNGTGSLGTGSAITLSSDGAITTANTGTITSSGSGTVSLSTTNGSITNGVSIVSAEGSISLDANGLNSDLNINSSILNTGSGSILLTADDSILLASAGDISGTGSGDISLTSNTAVTDGDSGDKITMSDGAVIDSGSGTITFRSSGSNAGDITLGGLTTTNTTNTSVTITSDQSAVVDGGDTDVDIVTSGRIVIDAISGVGSGNALETTANSLDLYNTGSNHIEIVETDDVSIDRAFNTVNGGNISVQSTTGSITVSSGQSGISAVNAAITLNADGQNSDVNVQAALLNTSTGTLTITADDAVSFTAVGDYTTAGSGNVTVTSNTAVTDGDSGDGISMSDGSVVNAGSGKINLTATGSNAGNITLGGLISNNNNAVSAPQTESILITADAAVIDGGDSDLEINTSGTLKILAETGIGSGNKLETSVDILNLLNGTSGNIEIQESDAVTVLNAKQSTSGNIDLATTNGVLTVDDSSGGTLTLVQTVDSGIIYLSSGGAGGNNIIINDGITSASGNINISATANVRLTTDYSFTSSSGNFILTADSDSSLDGSQVLDLKNDSVNGDLLISNSGTGGILAYADGDIRVDTLSSNGSGQILTQSSSNSIIDGNGAANNILTTGNYSASAATGIGSSDWIETTVASLSLSNSSSGNIQVIDLDHVTIAGVTQSVSSAELRITAGNSISNSGSILSSGKSYFVAGVANGDHIDLGYSGNNFSDEVYYTLLSSNDLTVFDNSTLSLNGTEAGGDLLVNNLKVTAAGITQAVNLTVSGQSELTHINGGIKTDLTTKNNDFQGTVDLISSADFDLKDINDLNLGITSVSGTLNANSGGSITTDKSIVGTDMNLDASNRISLGKTNVGGTLSLKSGSDVSQTDGLTSENLTVDSGGSIALGNSNNQLKRLGSVSRGGALNLFDSQGGLTIDGDINTGNTANDVTIRTVGDLKLSSGLNIKTSGAGNDILLQGQGGQFYNYAGASVFDTDSRWVVYAEYFADLGSLLGDFQLYGVSYPIDPVGGSGFYWEKLLLVDPADVILPSMTGSPRDITSLGSDPYAPGFRFGSFDFPKYKSKEKMNGPYYLTDNEESEEYLDEKGDFDGRYNEVYSSKQIYVSIQEEEEEEEEEKDLELIEEEEDDNVLSKASSFDLNNENEKKTANKAEVTDKDVVMHINRDGEVYTGREQLAGRLPQSTERSTSEEIRVDLLINIQLYLNTIPVPQEDVATILVSRKSIEEDKRVTP